MNRSRIHVRLIPAMIVASVILLSYKLIGISEALDLFQNPIKLTSAVAQEQEDEKANAVAEDSKKNDGPEDSNEGVEGKKKEDTKAAKKEKNRAVAKATVQRKTTVTMERDVFAEQVDEVEKQNDNAMEENEEKKKAEKITFLIKES